MNVEHWVTAKKHLECWPEPTSFPGTESARMIVPRRLNGKNA
jgi:hypothetical protein